MAEAPSKRFLLRRCKELRAEIAAAQPDDLNTFWLNSELQMVREALRMLDLAKTGASAKKS